MAKATAGHRVQPGDVKGVKSVCTGQRKETCMQRIRISKCTKRSAEEKEEPGWDKAEGRVERGRCNLYGAPVKAGRAGADASPQHCRHSSSAHPCIGHPSSSPMGIVILSHTCRDMIACLVIRMLLVTTALKNIIKKLSLHSSTFPGESLQTSPAIPLLESLQQTKHTTLPSSLSSTFTRFQQVSVFKLVGTRILSRSGLHCPSFSLPQFLT